MRKKTRGLNQWNNKAYKLRINLVIFILLFCGASTAIADSRAYCVHSGEYCANTSPHSEKIIGSVPPFEAGSTGTASSSTVTTSEQNLCLVYEFALFSTKNSVKLKKNQCAWFKKKELCQDVDCIMATNKNRISELESIIDGHPNKPASPENSDLKGLWFSDGGAQARYGNILITDNTIVWGGSESATPNIYCKTKYSIEREPLGTTFKDQRGGTYVLNEKSQFKTYKLKLKSRKCLGNLTYLRFTLPFKIPNYADVIEYYIYDNIFGYLRFGKSSN